MVMVYNTILYSKALQIFSSELLGVSVFCHVQCSHFESRESHVFSIRNVQFFFCVHTDFVSFLPIRNIIMPLSCEKSQ